MRVRRKENGNEFFTEDCQTEEYKEEMRGCFTPEYFNELWPEKDEA